MRKVAMLLGVLVAIGILTPSIAMAGSEGRKNTAIGLTAATVGAWARSGKSTGRRNTAVALTGATAYAWYRHHQASTSEAKQRAYREGYRDGRHHRYVHHKGYRHDNGRKLGHYKHHHRGHGWGHH